MKKIILGGITGLLVLIFSTPASSLTPYDNFSGTFINRDRWVGAELVREIDAYRQKLVSKVACPNLGDSFGYTYRWRTNNLYFINPNSVNSMEADVSVLEVLHTNPTTDTGAMLTGRWYNVGTPGPDATGDISARVMIEATPAGGLIARWQIWENTNADGTTWGIIGRGNFATPIYLGATYKLYIEYDGGNHRFIFRVGAEEVTFGPTGLPAAGGNAGSPYKSLASRVWLTLPSEKGYVSATFDNVYKNGSLYDDFSPLIPTIPPAIDPAKWTNYEIVREISGGRFRSKVRSSSSSFDSPALESYLSFIDLNPIKVVQAKVTPLAYQNDLGLTTTARIFTRFYHDGTPGKGYTGDVQAQIGIGWTDTTAVATWVVNRINDEARLSYTTLASGNFATPIVFGTTYPLFLSWDGAQFTFKFGSEVATYTPTGTVAPPNKPALIIGTRIFNPSGKEAATEALFDDVMVNSIVVPGTALEFGMVAPGSYRDKGFNVMNDGPNNVTINSATSPSSPFTIQTNNCAGKTLGPGESCDFVIRFAPTTLTRFGSGIDISTSDPDQATVPVAFAGSGGVPAAQMSAGGFQSFVLKPDGTLWGWGNNDMGQLGDGSRDRRISPRQTGTDTDWAAISSGGLHTLALKWDGTLWAWGGNDSGQVGDGTLTTRNYPTQIGTDTDWVAIATGFYHSLALKSDGTLWAWGGNSYGQLGDGTTIDKYFPVKVNSDTNWAYVSARYFHTMALKSDGTLWAWGWNNAGQLGDGTTTDKNSPVKVGSDTDWASVAAGRYHTLALKSGGTLWAWGSNGYGQVGDGSGLNRLAPVRISIATNWSAIAAGWDSSLALAADGSLRAWGNNNYGQLGDGTTSNRITPTLIGTGWSEISAGGYHSFCRKIDGTYWSWGWNAYGQLGDGTTTDKNLPAQIGSDTDWIGIGAGAYYSFGLKSSRTLWNWGANGATGVEISSPLQLGSDSDWAYTNGGYYHNQAIKSDSSLWSWGSNQYGQLGDGTLTSSGTPKAVSEPGPWYATAGGWGHTVALKTDGSLWAWGLNSYGQLGDGTTTDQRLPVRIGLASDWAEVSAGYHHTVARKSDGTLWAWGWNAYGQLGDGTTADKHLPFKIGSDTNWIAIASGYGHTVALKNDGSLRAWGLNHLGQLGDGSTIQKNSPVPIGSDRDWTAIAAPPEGFHTLAIKTDRTLWAWGANGYGQLGDGSNAQRNSPVRISSESWAGVVAGRFFSLGVKSDQTLWGWGHNGFGQLGDGSVGYKTSAVEAILPPSAPIPISPAPYSGGVSLNPTVSWEASVGATDYQLQVSTSPTFDTLIVNQTLTSTSQPLIGLLNNTTYYWRVSATGPLGTSIWAAGSFSTLPLGALDSDGDGVPDAIDNCPMVYNPGQEDFDGDGVGDACDNCPDKFNRAAVWTDIFGRLHNDNTQPDIDLDGKGDSCDIDADGDGYVSAAYGGDDCVDTDPAIYPGSGCAGTGALAPKPPKTSSPPDTDRDGIPDVSDNCPNMANADQLDSDSDGVGNACDSCPYFANADQVVPLWYKDLDGDGYSDGTTKRQCDRPAGYKLAGELIVTAGDCNDSDPAVNPGMTEVASNGKDDDCNPGTPDTPKAYDIVFEMPGYDTWLPEDGKTATVNAKVVGSSGEIPGTPITFSLVRVTNYPGKYTNDSSTDTSSDFNYTVSGNQVTFASRDSGGSITIRGEATVTLTSGATVLVQNNFTLPKDTDGDGLADAWEIANLGNLTYTAADDPDNDRLTNFEEYRGFKWGQLDRVEPGSSGGKYKTPAYVPQAAASHFRGNPLRKDLFVKFSNYDSANPFAIGEAFYNAGVDVHAVDVAAATGLGQTNIGVVTVNNELGGTYTGGPANIVKRGIRDWEWDTKGYSGIGNLFAYGTSTTYQKALDCYFADKPYKDGSGSVAPNGSLDPIGSVGDQNDNGVLDAGETSLDGDLVVVAAAYTQQLTVFDVNNNGMVELPLASDPSSIDPAYEYTKAQVLKHTITHEMGHAVGMTHTSDYTCVMYQFSNNWSRDGKFSSYAAGQMQIHNP